MDEPVTKGYAMHDSTYMECPAQIHRQEVDVWLLGLGKEGLRSDC